MPSNGSCNTGTRNAICHSTRPEAGLPDHEFQRRERRRVAIGLIGRAAHAEASRGLMPPRTGE